MSIGETAGFGGGSVEDIVVTHIRLVLGLLGIWLSGCKQGLQFRQHYGACGVGATLAEFETEFFECVIGNHEMDFCDKPQFCMIDLSLATRRNLFQDGDLEILERRLHEECKAPGEGVLEQLQEICRKIESH
ncbi:hypothetical protein [Pseudomaricurvus alcaniphilus]|uniref:hypothetical protein n=1 Tax=Pseudomaricurvus alcaniphilus TaxID=1166482 RepID=UPI001A9CDD92|nr:hypothetical protein [Pseudomaricurvus alcaniphilus]